MSDFYNTFDSDDLNDIDFGESQEQEESQLIEPIEEDNTDFFGNEDELEFSTSSDSSILNKFLASKGIVDSKVKVMDEDEGEVEVNFSELSEEEQLDILNSLSVPQTNPNISILEDEQALLSELRANNLSMNQFLELYKQSIIEEMGVSTETSYEIDQYDDKELFLLDLKNKYDLSDDELQLELEKELGNEELFNKKITKLREEYKQLEEQYKAKERENFETQQQQQYTQFVNQMTDIASNISDFHGLELEDTEINDTLSYLLELDDQGTSQFYKDLNDPKKLYEVAWYLKHGANAFRLVEDAYETEIAKLKTRTDKPRVVRQVNNENNIKTIDDIF